MDGLFRHLERTLDGGRRVFLALVVDNSRHSPGTAGAGLLLSEDGEIAGTLGGGVMERDILERGRLALARGGLAPELETLHHRRGAEGRASGMICAGHQTNLYAILGAGDRPWVGDLLARRAADDAGWLQVSPRGFAVIDGPGVGGREHREHQLEQGPAKGEFRYRRDLLERRRVAILGGGHCALALARVMARLGYRIEVCEATRKEPEAALGEHVAALHRVDDFAEAAGRLRWPELTQVVVMTSDFPSDVAALAGTLALPFPFIGLMGSPAKLAEIRLQLLDRGVSAAALERLTAPVGLEIGSHTPEEIAISIAAQILRMRSACHTVEEVA